ncbi:fructosamine kinase family protein [Longimicrobium sp.]|uniref:fructosamine kinase family protein n=1 Tax=Longimicrobium sp. TaxID=2029185 RepID=UPI002E357FA2|nr:fructosamine kinase family protein [Longimicrobium sp.]HEX6042419.1 fructosamine kinase family protein [Longimicrobium sp.]
MIPPALRDSVQARLGPIRGASPVGGGCINQGMRIDLADGRVFLKHNASAAPGMFAAEARGLTALREAADQLIVPRPLAWAEAEGDAPAWLALEWLEPGPRGADFAERLGRGLASLHGLHDGDERWGWAEDNFIGALPQENGRMESWSAFWRRRRLEPQLAMGRDAGRLPGRAAEWDRLFDRLPDLLDDAKMDGPSLLHGDLWGGNVVATMDGPALIDPAVYRGHREADLAMTELFGGFGERFYAAYGEAWPLLEGYPARRPVYQLWYLLVHVNLFGGGYVAQTAEVLRGIVR